MLRLGGRRAMGQAPQPAKHTAGNLRGRRNQFAIYDFRFAISGVRPIGRPLLLSCDKETWGQAGLNIKSLFSFRFCGPILEVFG